MTGSAPALKPEHLTSPWRNLRQGTLHLFLGFMAIVALFPFVWMVFASFKPFKELVQSKALLPINWTTENYTEILTRVNFEVAVVNSLYSAVTVTVITLLTSSALGFIFAKYRFWGKEYLFILLLVTMMVPFAVVLVPLYITIGNLNLVNKLWGFIITGLWSTFGVFLMRQFMEVIPYEYLDAARIDGASEWRIFFTIIIPLSTSPMAALGIFAFLANWDSFPVAPGGPQHPRQADPAPVAGGPPQHLLGPVRHVVGRLRHDYRADHSGLRLRLQVFHPRHGVDRHQGLTPAATPLETR